MSRIHRQHRLEYVRSPRSEQDTGVVSDFRQYASARSEVYSNETGQTYWVSTQAPSVHADTSNSNMIGTDVTLWVSTYVFFADGEVGEAVVEIELFNDDGLSRKPLAYCRLVHAVEFHPIAGPAALAAG